MDDINPAAIVRSAVCLSLVAIALAGAGMAGCPVYNVWHQHKEGEAEFARAESNRKILVQTANARAEAAEFEKQAQITQAQGVAEANKIIGDSLKSNPEYLTYLWLKGLQDGNNEVIYVATEAGIPITEASRLSTERHAKKQAHVASELEGSHVHEDRQSSEAVKE